MAASSGKSERSSGKSERAATPADAQSRGTARQESNRKFLADVAEMYTGAADATGDMRGLCDVAQMLNIRLLPPSRKVTVLLLGNHSSGKSSFVNWYCGAKVLKTGAAIETQGISFCTQGKRRETLTSQATLRLFPRFRGLERFAGVADLIETEVVASTAHAFPQLTLIDTPGLVDGSFVYPFDVEAVLLFLAAQVDQVLVFFDPMGQALCTRTMAVVTQLHQQCPEKIRHVLSKIDTVETDSDRQNVLIQVIQNLTSHVRPKTALRVPAIFLPKLGDEPPVGSGLEEVLSDIDRTINATVQRNLERARSDAGSLAGKLRAIASTEAAKWHSNMRTMFKTTALGCLWALACLAGGLFFLAEFELDQSLRPMLPARGAMPGANAAHAVLDYAVRAALAVPQQANMWIAIALVLVSLVYQLLVRCVFVPAKALDSSAAVRMKDALAMCAQCDKDANAMFESYLAETVHREEM